MKQCTVNSYDLELLRSLSRRLRQPSNGDTADAVAEGEQSPYSRFAPTRRPPETPAPRSSVAPPPPLLDPEELQTWDALLAWSMELCRSRAGFVVDSQGFVIASRGNVPDDGFEGMGAELCFAMEQMDKLDADEAALKAVELQYDGHTLASIRIPGNEEIGSYILGFIGSRALIPEIRDTVINQASLGLEYMM